MSLTCQLSSHYSLFPLFFNCVDVDLGPYSKKGTRIHKVAEYRSNLDPDPDFKVIVYLLVTCTKILQGRLRTTEKNIWKSVVLAVILAGTGAL